MLTTNKKCDGIEAYVTSRRAWLELLRIEEDQGTCAFPLFKKSNPVQAEPEITSSTTK